MNPELQVFCFVEAVLPPSLGFEEEMRRADVEFIDTILPDASMSHPRVKIELQTLSLSLTHTRRACMVRGDVQPSCVPVVWLVAPVPVALIFILFEVMIDRERQRETERERQRHAT